MRKFVCFTANSKYELTDKEIVHMKPGIDEFGNASIQVKYYEYVYM